MGCTKSKEERLLYNAKIGYYENVETLVEGVWGRVDINCVDEYGRTALILVMASRHTSWSNVNYTIRSTKLLINHSADVNIKDRDGWTALMYSVRFRPESLEQLIDAGADVHAKTNDGWTLLMLAARYRPKCVKPLLKAGADSHIDSQLDDGRTALMIAAESHFGNALAVKYLVNAGADLNLKNKKGQTALDIAASKNRKAFKILLKEAQYEGSSSYDSDYDIEIFF